MLLISLKITSWVVLQSLWHCTNWKTSFICHHGSVKRYANWLFIVPMKLDPFRYVPILLPENLIFWCCIRRMIPSWIGQIMLYSSIFVQMLNSQIISSLQEHPYYILDIMKNALKFTPCRLPVCESWTCYLWCLAAFHVIPVDPA